MPRPAWRVLNRNLGRDTMRRAGDRPLNMTEALEILKSWLRETAADETGESTVDDAADDIDEP